MSDSTKFNRSAGPPPPPPSRVPGWRPPPDLVGTVLAGRYKVISVIGDGGMGRVYLGEHVTLRKKIAIKVLKQEFCHDRTNVERFLQEARAASMIRHENIVDIIDFGEVPGGSVFFVMELLDGSDLADMIKELGRLPWLRTRNVLLQVVRALRAAHESGIIHRDMKPGNVFLTKRSSVADYVKVLDFGIAKVDDQNTGLTRTGAVFGTAGYMAPEQACGDPVDGRTDVYAVGCMMYEMLTGNTPFPGNNFMRVLTQHLNEPPRPPREAYPDADISEEVEIIILTALQKRPEDRFQDMGALEQAIAQANGEVATVPPQNRPLTSGGTMVLQNQGSPFAGMTPGQPPPDLAQRLADTNGDATVVLDNVAPNTRPPTGAPSTRPPVPDGATMMLDGMGGAALGGGGSGDGATVMLDGMGGAGIGDFDSADTTTAGDSRSLKSPIARLGKKRLAIIAGSAAAVVLAVVLAVVFTNRGGKDDASSESDEVAVKGEQPATDPSDGANSGPSNGAAGEKEPTPDAEAGELAEGGAAADGGELVIDDPAGTDNPAGTDDPATPEPTPPEPDAEPATPTPTKPAKVKAELSSADVGRGMRRVKRKVSACRSQGGLPGMKVKVRATIKDGRVSSVSARPPHTNTPVGKCVAGAVKSARFVKAKQAKTTEHTFTL